MPKVELTMNQWGLVLRALRKDIWGGAHLTAASEQEEKDLRIVEDRIIDMAFNLAKQTEDSLASKREDRKELERRKALDNHG
jgi:hypothetical protein